MKTENKVGIIIGRFQCSYIHEGYRSLFTYVMQRHSRVIVFIGNSPLKGPDHDPLDFISRRMMIQSAYKTVEIYPINDVGDVDRWSKLLDSQIASIVSSTQDIILYGSRDKFQYTGRYPVEHIEATEGISSTEIRKQLGLYPQNEQAWREGVIWLSQNRFPVCYATVDMAVIDLNRNLVLLGRKPGETFWRFPGGFSDVGSPSYEMDALREVKEETSLEGLDVEYIGSHLIDDWRYRNQKDKIKTLFFAITSWNGEAIAGDDLQEVQWFTIESINPDTMLMKNHRILWTMLLNWIDKQTSRPQ